MTPENMARYRLDPNIAFWKELKNGSDHFEVDQDRAAGRRLRKTLRVRRDGQGRGVGERDLVRRFNRDDDVETLVAEKESRDNAKVAELAASGVKAIRTVYADGGQNPVFAGYKDTSDPEALAAGPQEIVLSEEKPAPAVVKVAGADAARRRAAAMVAQAAASGAGWRGGQTPNYRGRLGGGSRAAAGAWGSSAQNVKQWLHLGGQDQAAPADGYGLCARPADPDRRSAAAPPRREVAACRIQESAPAAEAGRGFARRGDGSRHDGDGAVAQSL